MEQQDGRKHRLGHKRHGVSAKMPIPASPTLYKFLDVNGARLTLRNRTFKHAKPSDFNDKADMTVESLFPGSDEVVLAAAWSDLSDIRRSKCVTLSKR
jgi:hypothetical protein